MNSCDSTDKSNRAVLIGEICPVAHLLISHGERCQFVLLEGSWIHKKPAFGSSGVEARNLLLPDNRIDSDLRIS